MQRLKSSLNNAFLQRFDRRSDRPELSSCDGSVSGEITGES